MRSIGATRRTFIELAHSSLLLLSPIDPVADLICRYTPTEFRSAVCQTSRFLYRGETSVLQPSILHPDPDLLVEGTYPENDAKLALEYFICLEAMLTSRATPSIGHIGTPNYEDAAEWGEVVSVWPLGNHLSYVYPQDSRTFYPGGDCSDNKNVIVEDHGLATALVLGHEVLFTSWFDDDVRGLPPDIVPAWVSAFVAIPSSDDAKLKRSLEMRNYGL